MSSDYEPADPIAKGIVPTAKQNISDLFKWKQRVVLSSDGKESRCQWQNPAPLQNPISLLALLSGRDWLFFICGFLSWTADAFDYHALSIQTTKFAAYYKRNNTSITTAITLTLLIRSVGAAIFGLLGDRFGRKWPMVFNMIILGILQIGTVYAKNFHVFLGVRSLFGLFMGGVYGNAIAMALEHCPVQARGLMSGILQQGYSFGYVLAACANLGVGGSPESFKTVFWVAAGISISVGLVRICFPESKQFLEAKKDGNTKVTAATFWHQTRIMLVKDWRLCIYCIFLMTWFNFWSHTSQDSYTTFMLQSKKLSNSAASRASIWMKTGACISGPIIGYVSQLLGRRRSMIISAFLSCLFIPFWILPTTERTLSASAFLIQFCVQGAWSVIPIHLNELSPAGYRSLFVGTTYQIGNMISSPSVQIVNALAERLFVKGPRGKGRVNAYGPVMGVATAIIAVGIICTAAVGPERRGRRFEEDEVAGTVKVGSGQDEEVRGVEGDRKEGAEYVVKVEA